ncbi:unnamed protein product [Urochloa humidicola]
MVRGGGGGGAARLGGWRAFAGQIRGPPPISKLERDPVQLVGCSAPEEHSGGGIGELAGGRAEVDEGPGGERTGASHHVHAARRWIVLKSRKKIIR